MTKKTFGQRAKPWITPGLIITIGGLIITGIGFIFDKVVEQNTLMIESEQKQFTTPEMRIKTEEHVNEPYNPVNAYKQSVELTEQTAIIEKILEDNRKRDSLAKVKEAEKDKSRDARDSVNRLILEKLKKLDSL